MSATSNDHRAALVGLLQRAYSGELAAAHAYHGHARSLQTSEERTRLYEIEADEWHHRRLVGDMLLALGSAPRRWLEVRAHVIGRVLSVSCHLAGWFLPMYGAGRLERRNVGEYALAAQLAGACGMHAMQQCLLGMTEVEWDHEAYFRARVARHRALRVFPLWPALAPREEIRLAIGERGGDA